MNRKSAYSDSWHFWGILSYRPTRYPVSKMHPLKCQHFIVSLCYWIRVRVKWIIYTQPFARISTELLQIVLNVILGIFSFDHILLEIRGSPIVKKLHPPTYIQMLEALLKNNITCAAGRGTFCNSCQQWSRCSAQSSLHMPNSAACVTFYLRVLSQVIICKKERENV